mmetsp:Transcript_6397/g.20582  ORF Transcript_6397/g.20582 Transcript_6397/m.20582 type:complete len:240 (+) Transcript_6397:127-846(+)
MVGNQRERCGEVCDLPRHNDRRADLALGQQQHATNRLLQVLLQPLLHPLPRQQPCGGGRGAVGGQLERRRLVQRRGESAQLWQRLGAGRRDAPQASAAVRRERGEGLAEQLREAAAESAEALDHQRAADASRARELEQGDAVGGADGESARVDGLHELCLGSEERGEVARLVDQPQRLVDRGREEGEPVQLRQKLSQRLRAAEQRGARRGAELIHQPEHVEAEALQLRVGRGGGGQMDG